MIIGPDIYPDSTKFYWLTWSATELGSETVISDYEWTVPDGLTLVDDAQIGLAVGARVTAPASKLLETFDLVCTIVTSAQETLHEILRIKVSKLGH